LALAPFHALVIQFQQDTSISFFGDRPVCGASRLLQTARNADAKQQTTPTMALGITDHMWLVGELLDATLATQPIDPVITTPDRRKPLRVIEGGKQ
jgi:hypothetical protein